MTRGQRINARLLRLRTVQERQAMIALAAARRDADTMAGHRARLDEAIAASIVTPGQLTGGDLAAAAELRGRLGLAAASVNQMNASLSARAHERADALAREGRRREQVEGALSAADRSAERTGEARAQINRGWRPLRPRLSEDDQCL